MCWITVMCEQSFEELPVRSQPLINCWKGWYKKDVNVNVACGCVNGWRKERLNVSKTNYWWNWWSTQPKLFQNFLPMTASNFDLLLNLVEPLIAKQTTFFRNPGRLALTLRFLATDESFKSLQYQFRIPQSTISAIVPEV